MKKKEQSSPAFPRRLPLRTGPPLCRNGARLRLFLQGRQFYYFVTRNIPAIAIGYETIYFEGGLQNCYYQVTFKERMR
jgi:hypothetical protein